jgi:hypothetical protein
MKNAHKYDLIGITGSALCIVHCLFFPVIFMYSGEFHHHYEAIPFLDLDYLFLGIAGLAVYSATSKSGSSKIKIALWLSLAACLTGVVLHHYIPNFKYILYLGSLGLIVSHFFNMRYCNQCS